jgi:hypothetical protein
MSDFQSSQAALVPFRLFGGQHLESSPEYEFSLDMKAAGLLLTLLRELSVQTPQKPSVPAAEAMKLLAAHAGQSLVG